MNEGQTGLNVVAKTLTNRDFGMLHYGPILSVKAENIPSIHSLFKLQSVALIVRLQLYIQ